MEPSSLESKSCKLSKIYLHSFLSDLIVLLPVFFGFGSTTLIRNFLSHSGTTESQIAFFRALDAKVESGLDLDDNIEEETEPRTPSLPDLAAATSSLTLNSDKSIQQSNHQRHESAS